VDEAIVDAIAIFKGHWNTVQRDTIFKVLIQKVKYQGRGVGGVNRDKAITTLGALPWNAEQLRHIRDEFNTLLYSFDLNYEKPIMQALRELGLQWSVENLALFHSQLTDVLDLMYNLNHPVRSHHAVKRECNALGVGGALAPHWNPEQLNLLCDLFWEELDSDNAHILQAAIESISELIPYWDPVIHLPILSPKIYALLNHPRILIQEKTTLALGVLERHSNSSNPAQITNTQSFSPALNPGQIETLIIQFVRDTYLKAKQEFEPERISYQPRFD
jgi:hypothetical protein